MVYAKYSSAVRVKKENVCWEEYGLPWDIVILWYICEHEGRDVRHVYVSCR